MTLGVLQKPPSQIEFLDLGDETEIVIVHEGFLDVGVRAAHEEGWDRLLRRLYPAPELAPASTNLSLTPMDPRIIFNHTVEYYLEDSKCLTWCMKW